MKIFPSAAVFPYRPAGVLRVSGPDALTFLQGQFTNDLSKMAPGHSAYGLWLDRKGRVLADSHVLRDPGADAFWIVSIGSPAAAIEGPLSGHIIADDVSIMDETAAWSGISIVGPGAGDWLAGQARPGLMFPGRRDAAENWEWVLRDADAAAALAEVSGARILDSGDIERMRIASGIPSIPADIGVGDLPNEGGLDRDAISYSKGCYIGQEVMARIKSRGRTRRKLVRVRGSGVPPSLPAALWRADKREGELRSAVPVSGGFAGLALVSAGSAESGLPLSLASGAPGTVEFVVGA